MPADLPVALVLENIVRHTPVWVWGVLALLVLAGALQMRDHTQPRRRLVMLPLGLGAYSLWGALALTALPTTALVAWTTGLALALLAGSRLPWAARVRHESAGDVFRVPATIWPLVLMLAVFLAKYAAAIALVFHREWATQPAFALVVGLGYGAMSGLLGARALAILAKAGGWPAGLVPSVAAR